MKIVVDTNIVFSALLNTDGQIADLIFNSSSDFEFYSCFLLLEEIQRHKAKLLKISKLSETQLTTSQFHVFSRINLISEDQIPPSVWKKAIELVQGVDMDDVAFVALTEYMDAHLWTGDKRLIKGISAKGFSKMIRTEDLVAIRNH